MQVCTWTYADKRAKLQTDKIPQIFPHPTQHCLKLFSNLTNYKNKRKVKIFLLLHRWVFYFIFFFFRSERDRGTGKIKPQKRYFLPRFIARWSGNKGQIGNTYASLCERHLVEVTSPGGRKKKSQQECIACMYVSLRTCAYSCAISKRGGYACHPEGAYEQFVRSEQTSGK